MEKGNTGFWGRSTHTLATPATVEMPPVTNALVPAATTPLRYMSKDVWPKTSQLYAAQQVPALYNLQTPPPYGPGYMWPPMYAPPYGYLPMPSYTAPQPYQYPVAPQQQPMMYQPQAAAAPVPVWSTNMQKAQYVH